MGPRDSQVPAEQEAEPPQVARPQGSGQSVELLQHDGGIVAPGEMVPQQVGFSQPRYGIVRSWRVVTDAASFRQPIQLPIGVLNVRQETPTSAFTFQFLVLPP